jgi:hypothetical protein
MIMNLGEGIYTAMGIHLGGCWRFDVTVELHFSYMCKGALLEDGSTFLIKKLTVSEM